MEKKDALEVVSVDELNLQEECVQLPSQYLRASYQAAELRNELAVNEIKFKSAEAELSKNVRDNPGKYGIEKVTVASVDDVVSASKELSVIRGAMQATRHELDRAQGLMSALEIKKRSLTNLVSLYSMSYQGTIKKPSSMPASNKERQAQEAITEQRKKRKVSFEDEEED